MLVQEFLCLQRYVWREVKSRKWEKDGRSGKSKKKKKKNAEQNPICESIKERHFYSVSNHLSGSFCLMFLLFTSFYSPTIHLTSSHLHSAPWKLISKDLQSNITLKQVRYIFLYFPWEWWLNDYLLHVHSIPHIHNREIPNTTAALFVPLNVALPTKRRRRTIYEPFKKKKKKTPTQPDTAAIVKQGWMAGKVEAHTSGSAQHDWHSSGKRESEGAGGTVMKWTNV